MSSKKNTQLLMENAALRKALESARIRADSAIEGYALVCEQRRKAFLAFEYIRTSGLTYELRQWINGAAFECDPPKPPIALLRLKTIY